LEGDAAFVDAVADKIDESFASGRAAASPTNAAFSPQSFDREQSKREAKIQR